MSISNELALSAGPDSRVMEVGAGTTACKGAEADVVDPRPIFEFVFVLLRVLIVVTVGVDVELELDERTGVGVRTDGREGKVVFVDVVDALKPDQNESYVRAVEEPRPVLLVPPLPPVNKDGLFPSALEVALLL